MARDNKIPDLTVLPDGNSASKGTTHAVTSGRPEIVLCETLKL
jgi:hypothetical protein